MKKDKEMKKKTESLTKKTMYYFREKTKAYKGYFWLMLVTRIGIAIVSMITPLLLKNIIDLMVANPTHPSAATIATIGGIVIRRIIVAGSEWGLWRLFDI